MHPSSADDDLPTQALGPKPGGDTAPTAPGAGSGPTAPRPDPSAADAAWPDIAGYEIEGVLGQGGMGLVYRARHLGLKRVVALKVLRAQAATVTDAARFQREAEAVARLRHPNIVAVHDAGTYRDTAGQVRPYLALEYVAGTSLDRALREAALPPPAAARLARDLARALAAVHGAGIVHRDIKPANVILQIADCRLQIEQPDAPGSAVQSAICNLQSAIPKLTDFGLALTDDDDVALTRGEQLLGTPGYLAPEQVRSGPRAAGPASDLHALGAVLYECLTGRPAFKAATIHEALELVLHTEPVAVRQLSPGVPRDLETITLKCLHKDPARRYASAAELADDLDRYLAGRPIRARRVSPAERGWRWARRQPALAALGVACTALGVALLAMATWYAGRLGHAEGLRQAADADAAAAREIAATSDYHALLARARQHADRREPGWRQAGLRDVQLAAAQETRARSPGEIRDQTAAFLLGTDLVPRPGFAPGFSGCAVAFHPTQPTLAVAEFKAWWSATVVLFDLTGRPLRRLSFPTYALFRDKGPVPDGARATAFSPDGRWLVVGARSGWLHRWDLTRPDARPVSWAGHTAEVRDVCFCPLTHALFTTGADGAVRRWSLADGWKRTDEYKAHGRLDGRASCGELLLLDGDRAHRLARPNLKPTAAPFAAAGGLGRLTAPAGPLVVIDGGRIKLLDAATGEVTGALRGPGLDSAHESGIDDAAVSPDGGLLASVDEPTCHARVWSLASGRLLANIPLPGIPARVAWRPDGAVLAILAGRRVLLFDVQRPASLRFAGLHDRPVLAAACLPAGRLAALAGDRPTGRGELAVWSLSGHGAECQRRQPLTLPESRLPARLVSDDAGGWLAWTERGLLAWAPADRLAEPRRTPTDEAWGLALAEDGRLCYTSTLNLLAQGPGDALPRRLWDNAASDQVTGLGGLWPLDCGPRYTLVGGRDGTLRLFAPKGGEPLASWKCSAREIRAVSLDEAERSALVGTAAGEVFLFALPGGAMKALARHRDQVDAALFLGDGLAATASADGVLRLWRRDGGALAEWLTLRFRAPVKALARDRAGGQLAVVLAGERAARVLDLAGLRDELRAAGAE